MGSLQPWYANIFTSNVEYEKYGILFSTILGYVDCWISILLPEVVHTSIHSRRDDVKPIRIRLHVHEMISKGLLHSY